MNSYLTERHKRSTKLSQSLDNLVENAIRPLAIGRKNYLFCGNDASAVRAAMIYSLISSCKAVDVDPREWMTDVLLRLPLYKNNKENLGELLPINWKKGEV